jgi:hypothetical protein
MHAKYILLMAPSGLFKLFKSISLALFPGILPSGLAVLSALSHSTVEYFKSLQAEPKLKEKKKKITTANTTRTRIERGLKPCIWNPHFSQACSTDHRVFTPSFLSGFSTGKFKFCQDRGSISDSYKQAVADTVRAA